MVILPTQFYLQGLKYKPSGISVVTGGENGSYILTILGFETLNNKLSWFSIFIINI